MKRNLTFLAFFMMVALGLLYNSCKQEDTGTAPGTGPGTALQTTATINGRILDNQTSAPIPLASVRLVEASKSINVLDTTATDGTYGFSVDLRDTFSLLGTLTVTKSGYQQGVTSVPLLPGRTTPIPDLPILRDTTVVVGGGATTYPNTIAFISTSQTALSVYGVGGNETAILTFEVRDSLGFPVDIGHQDTVVFNVNPNTLGHANPLKTLTNAAGRVATTLNSDIFAGTVQVVARLLQDSPAPPPFRYLQSEPVLIVIHSGLPDQAHFTLGATQANFPGYSWLGRTNNVRVLVGDRYSNPVQPRTAVYFNTTGGIIQAEGYTGGNGQASVTLYSGNPLPADPTLTPASLYGNGTGYAWITASTVGPGGVTVGDSMLMLFSGQAQVSATTSQITLASGGSQTFQLTVSDANGNPLSQGTTIGAILEVTSDSAVVVNYRGIPDQGFDDYLTRGPGRTDYSVTVFDATPGGATSFANFTLEITVSGTNGSAFLSIPGRIN